MKNNSRTVVFEGDNGISYFPPEMANATQQEKDRYRARAARRWDRAIARLDAQLAKDAKASKAKKNDK